LGLIPVSIANYTITVTASASLIAIAQFGSRGSGPKDTATLAQTLDQQLKKNHELLERNRHLMGEIASFRNNPLASIPVTQVHTLDQLTDKNQQLQKESQELVGEVAAARNKLAGPSEAHTKVKAGKTIATIAASLLSCVRRT
jgi:hypothetical protein